MPHTARRHGRTITLDLIRRRLTITVNGMARGCILARGRSHHAQTIWQPVTYDSVWLPEVCGDFTDAERALLEATTELDKP